MGFGALVVPTTTPQPIDTDPPIPNTPPTPPSVLGHRNNFGISFVAAFLKSGNNNGDLVAVVTAPQQSTVAVDIPLADVPQFPRLVVDSFTADMSYFTNVRLPSSGFTNAITLSGTADITVSLLNMGSCQAYTAIPQDALGRQYYVLTWNPANLAAGASSQIAITAVADNTQVLVDLKTLGEVSVIFNNAIYTQNDRIVIPSLAQHQTAIIHSNNDLSGTYIQSSSPVAVHAGTDVPVPPGASDDTSGTQLIPVETYGRQFVIAPPSDYAAGGFVKIVSQEPTTLVGIGSTSHTLPSAGSTLLHALSSNQPILVTSDKPIMVMYFTANPHHPSALMVPPVEQYNNYYIFNSYENVRTFTFNTRIVVSVASGRENGIVIDGVIQTSGVWTAVPASNMVVREFAREEMVAPNNHRVWHVDPTLDFGVYIYSAADSCLMSQHAGMRYQTLNQVPLTDPPVPTGTTTPRPTVPVAEPTTRPTVQPTTTLPVFTPTPAPIVTTADPIQYTHHYPIQPPHTQEQGKTIEISTNSTTPVNVHVFAVPAEPGFDYKRLVSIGNPFTVEVPASLFHSNTGLGSTHSIWVETDQDTANINAHSHGSCSSYLAKHIVDLGREYYVITWDPQQAGSGVSLCTIIGNPVEDTTLTLNFPPGFSEEYEGQIYDSNNPLTLELEEYEGFHIETSVSLTGLHILADRNIGLFCGNRDIIVGDTNPDLILDKTTVQFPPVSQWGQTFIIIPPPNNDNGAIITIMAAYDATDVTVDGTSRQLSRGENYIHYYTGQNAYMVESSKPIQVVHYTKSSAAGYAASAMIIPPVEQYQHEYTFGTLTLPGNSNVTDYLLIAVQTVDTQHVHLNNGTLPNNWVVLGTSGYSYQTLQIGDDSHFLTMTNSVNTFEALVIGHSEGYCTYAYPLGYGRHSLGNATTPSACLQSIDGSSYITAFIENNLPTVSLRLFMTTTSQNDVTVEITAPLWTGTPQVNADFLLEAGTTQSIPIATELRLTDSGVDNKGLQVIASHNIMLFGLNHHAGSCDAFVVLPTPVLGTEYVVMTYHLPLPTHVDVLAVVGVEDDTSVTLELPKNWPFDFVIDGIQYGENAVIQITLNKYQTFQLEETFNPLSGTYIVSDKPVAVYSGNRYDEVKDLTDPNVENSHLVEQLLPVDSWGTEYYIVTLPDAVIGDFLRIVTSEEDTDISFMNEVFSVSDAFAFRNRVLPPDTFATLIATKPVAVAQYARSGDNKNPAMVLVPSRAHYLYQYTISFPDMTGITAETFNNYLIIIIEQNEIDNLEIIGATIDAANWREIANSFPAMMGQIIPVTTTQVIVTNTNRRRFSAIVYGSSSSDCAYAYPAGFCLEEEDEEIDDTEEPETEEPEVSESTEGTEATQTLGSTVAMTSDTEATETTATDDMGSSTMMTSDGSTETVTMDATTMDDTTPATSEDTTAATVTDVTVTDVTITTVESVCCDAVNVTSSDLAPEFAGVYHRHSTLEGRYVYADMSCPHYLYFVDSNTQFWFFSPELESNRGYIMGNEDVESPDEVEIPWRAYDNATQQWLNDSTITVQCLCLDNVTTSCDSLTVNNTDLALSIDGRFYSDDVINGRISYYNNEAGLYLYYYQLTACHGYWTVGPEVGGAASIAHVESDEDDIAMVSGPWKLLVDGSWVEDSNTAIVCS